MTFAAWYDSTIVPQLNETLKNVPVQAREPLRTASRQTMAACWNAALAAACDRFGEHEGTDHGVEEELRAPMTIKFEGEMQKFSQ